jgi:hypothetical protein
VKALTTTARFHSYSDVAFRHRIPGVVETVEKEHVVIQERDLSVRMYPHFHPFADDLLRRLLSTSTSGLLAVDTDYVATGGTLPDSVEVAVAKDTPLVIRAGARVVMQQAVTATSGGVPIALSAGVQVELAADVTVPLGQPQRLTLVDGWPVSPPVGQSVPLTADMAANVRRTATVALPGGVQIKPQPEAAATLDAGADVLLLAGAKVSIASGTAVTPLTFKRRPVWYDDGGFKARYNPSALVHEPLPVRDLDFTFSGAYSAYNWELFFHIPLTIAVHLSKNQRFADAQRWFHLLWDPTDDSDGPTPQRFWKVRPFQTTDVQKIEELLVNLATGADPALRDETIRSIEAWKDAPFRPHLIARYRQQAYMYKTVMAYLDNLIAWGDSLFRTDAPEAVDDALMIYVLAANILGPRPQPVPAKGTIKRQTYASLRKDLDAFGNAMRDVEAAIPFDLMPPPTDEASSFDRLTTVTSIGKALYFCVPRNDKMLGYWDTVADRLFKIRNSLNAQGVFRQLPLFAPPIDPALLVRATAAGLDTAAVVNGLNQPLPLVRFQLLVQKAAEICQEVKALGQSLLSAMEKEDGEAMAILRARHERAVLDMVEQVRYTQAQEAAKAREATLASLALAVQRYSYYERQQGRAAEEIENAIPEMTGIDADALREMRLVLREPVLPLADVPFDIAQDLNASGGVIVSSHEAEELEKSGLARDLQDAVRFGKLAAQGIRMLPDFGIKFHFWGLGGDMQIGGTTLGEVAAYAADVTTAIADRLSFEATTAGRIGGYARRAQDWAHQSNLAAGEISQTFKQLRAAELREAIAVRELQNHRDQQRHAAEIQRFLNQEGAEKGGKATNKALYTWMKREVKGLYAQCFQFAFDVAKKAERALQHELGDYGLRLLQFSYLAGKEGLLAGEKLFFDIKRMEMAYHDMNRREYELTRHVSLLQLDPDSLLRLRTTGRCTVKLPEGLFDMDGPGHYFRRIKSVAVTIPSVIGAYASVNCTLTLLKSSIRTSATVGGAGYERQGPEDDRFDDFFGSMQSIVTSSAQNDSGLFETSLRDERYLPFEHAGVISEWQLELPANPVKNEPRQFDYETISDVILHLRYTAREGGGLLRKAAAEALQAAIKSATAPGSVRLFSARRDFPTEWVRFRRQAADASGRFDLSFTLRPEHYPFWSESYLKVAKQIAVAAKTGAAGLTIVDARDPARSDALANDTALGLVRGKLAAVKPFAGDKPLGEFKVSLSDQKVDDVWIAIQWGAE